MARTLNTTHCNWIDLQDLASDQGRWISFFDEYVLKKWSYAFDPYDILGLVMTSEVTSRISDLVRHEWRRHHILSHCVSICFHQVGILLNVHKRLWLPYWIDTWQRTQTCPWDCACAFIYRTFAMIYHSSASSDGSFTNPAILWLFRELYCASDTFTGILCHFSLHSGHLLCFNRNRIFQIVIPHQTL